MTPLEHNRYLGLAHLGYSGFQVLMLILTMGLVGVVFTQISEDVPSRDPELERGVIAFVFIFATAFNTILVVPSIVAGLALLKRRRWAKIAGIVAGAVAVMNVPVGAAVAVYTFWFLFSKAGSELYDQKKEMPPPPPRDWAEINQTSLSYQSDNQ